MFLDRSTRLVISQSNSLKMVMVLAIHRFSSHYALTMAASWDQVAEQSSTAPGPKSKIGQVPKLTKQN